MGDEIGQLLALAAIMTAMGDWRCTASFGRHAIAANVVLMTAGFVLFGLQMTGYFIEGAHGCGAVNLALAFLLGARMPEISLTLAAGVVGFLGYGVSLVLFVLALRFLGTARTGAYFSTAPFIGALLALALFGDAVTLQLIVAAGLMGVGLWLHLVERHAHVHEPMARGHAHVHDARHQHDHEPDDPPGEPHVHHHAHARLIHGHPHYPDLHHRHGHD